MGKPNAKRVLMINGRQQWEYLTDSLLHGLRTLLGAGFVDYEKRLFMYKGTGLSSDCRLHSLSSFLSPRKLAPSIDVFYSQKRIHSICSTTMSSGLREEAISRGFREYGKGFSYAYALSDDPGIDRDGETIRRQIKSRHFDLVVIGQMFQPRNLPIEIDMETTQNLTKQFFWPEISRSYGKHEVALLDGLDYHKPVQREFLVKAARHGTLFVREIDRCLHHFFSFHLY